MTAVSLYWLAKGIFSKQLNARIAIICKFLFVVNRDINFALCFSLSLAEQLELLEKAMIRLIHGIVCNCHCHSVFDIISIVVLSFTALYLMVHRCISNSIESSWFVYVRNRTSEISLFFRLNVFIFYCG